MDFIYFAVKSAPDFNDKLKACQQYFITDGGFTSAFILAIGLAFLFALIYYVVAHMSFKWPSIVTWLVSLVVCMCVTFFATGMQTGIHSNGAFPHVVEKQFKKRTAELTVDEKAPLEAQQAKLKNQFKKSYFGSSPVNRLCWTNLVVGGVFFYLFSICMNGISRHGGNTPHRGFFTKNN